MKSMQAQATKFISAAYGKVAETCISMTECRVKVISLRFTRHIGFIL